MDEAAAKVAVVDDERHVRELLELSLSRRGFLVRSANDGQSGLNLVKDWHPDVVILDVMMPKLDGLSLLPIIRTMSEVPVLMLSAKGDVADRIDGMERGADDYIAKPFEVDELVARIRASLRRPHLAKPNALAYADLRVVLNDRTVWRGASVIHLTNRQYDLLCVLLRHPGRVFSRDHLLDRVWGDAEVGQGCVDTYIGYLRNRIDAPPRAPLIQTIRGAGYTIRAET